MKSNGIRIMKFIYLVPLMVACATTRSADKADMQREYDAVWKLNDLAKDGSKTWKDKIQASALTSGEIETLRAFAKRDYSADQLRCYALFDSKESMGATKQSICLETKTSARHNLTPFFAALDEAQTGPNGPGPKTSEAPAVISTAASLSTPDPVPGDPTAAPQGQQQQPGAKHRESGSYAVCTQYFMTSTRPHEDITIPVGTMVAGRGGTLMYTVVRAGTIFAKTADIFRSPLKHDYEIALTVMANNPGTKYVVPPKTITNIVTPVVGITATENRAPRKGKKASCELKEIAPETAAK